MPTPIQDGRIPQETCRAVGLTQGSHIFAYNPYPVVGSGPHRKGTDAFFYLFHVACIPVTTRSQSARCIAGVSWWKILKTYATDLPFLCFWITQTNLSEPGTREAGARRKAAIGIVTDDAPKYRDRAAERRVAFNQPDKPLPEEAPVQVQKRKFAEGPKPPPPPATPGVEPGKDEANKGNQLLAKMGWKTGSGLGLGGEGRVDPVLVQQFEARAGLGASKGHDAAKWQGPGGFQQRALDMVGFESSVAQSFRTRGSDGVER